MGELHCRCDVREFFNVLSFDGDYFWWLNLGITLSCLHKALWVVVDEMLLMISFLYVMCEE